MVPDTNERVKIDLQIDAFKNARGLFGIQNAILTRKKKSPSYFIYFYPKLICKLYQSYVIIICFEL